jgi:hypothetical protein
MHNEELHNVCPFSKYNFFQWLFQPIQGSDLLFSSVIIFSQTVGLLGRVISPSQGRYLNTEQTHAHTKHPYPEWYSNPRSQRPSG